MCRKSNPLVTKKDNTEVLCMGRSHLLDRMCRIQPAGPLRRKHEGLFVWAAASFLTRLIGCTDLLPLKQTTRLRNLLLAMNPTGSSAFPEAYPLRLAEDHMLAIIARLACPEGAFLSNRLLE